MPPASAVRSRSPRSDWRIGAGIAALVLAGLWSGAWLLAAHFAGSGFETWTAAEAAAGRQWTCPARSVDGYPFALAVHCERPTFHGEIAGHPSQGVVEGLSARMGLERPGAVVIGLRGPLHLRGEDDSYDLAASWETMAVTLDGVVGTPNGGDLAAKRLAVTLATPDSDNVNVRAATLTGGAGPAPDAMGDARFTFAATGVSLPTVDPIPGLEGPADAMGQGVLAHADLLQAPTVQRLDAWRRAGGSLQLAALDVRMGPFQGRATGTLGLDAAHRAAGRLETTVTGFEPIARHFGVPLAGVQIGGLLTSLLGGGKAASAPPGAVQLPLTLADGRLSVGPFVTGVRLLPIY